jgi:hypothetical protein
MADAVTAAASRTADSSSRLSRTKGIPLTRKFAFATMLLVAILAVAGIWLGRRGPDVALADVVRAMASVRNVHLIAWSVDKTGNQSDSEYYFQGPGKFVVLADGKKISGDDGKRYVKLYSISGQHFAEIKPSGSVLPFGKSDLLSIFMQEKALNYFLKHGKAEIISWKSERARDGRPLSVAEMTRAHGGTLKLYIDPATDLVYGWTNYDDAGNPVDGVERVEYNLDIDDSIFTVDIPEDAAIDDHISAEPARVMEKRKVMVEKLQTKGADVWCSSPDSRPSGGCGMLLEDGELYFMCLDYGLWVGYMPGENKVHVVGKVRVFSHPKESWKPDGRLDTIIEDGSFTPPSKPISLASLNSKRQHESTPLQRKRQALSKKLESSGAITICSEIDKGGSCGSKYHEGLRIEALDDGMAVYYLPDRNVYCVVGKAEVRYRNLRNGFTRIIEDGEVKGPGRAAR